MGNFTDEQDAFSILDLSDPINVTDPVDAVVVNDGDLSVTVTEVIDSFTFSTDTPAQVAVSETNDAVNLSFSEVLQPITNNITNDNSVFSGIASVDLGGHRIVVAIGSQIAYADNTIPSHSSIVTGIITQAVTSGQAVNVTISGEVIEGTWSWTLDKPIFLGGNGLMTQTVPSTGFLLQVGYPTSTTSIVVDIKTAITLSS